MLYIFTVNPVFSLVLYQFLDRNWPHITTRRFWGDPVQKMLCGFKRIKMKFGRIVLVLNMHQFLIWHHTFKTAAMTSSHPS